MTVNAKLFIQQGTTWAISWPITTPEGDPVDVTGWGVQAQIRASKTATEVLHEFTTTRENAFADQGAVTLSVTPNESSAWPWRSGVYDVELTDPTGRVARIAEGSVTVSAEVTR